MIRLPLETMARQNHPKENGQIALQSPSYAEFIHWELAFSD
jgi:hypothetical protein